MKLRPALGVAVLVVGVAVLVALLADGPAGKVSAIGTVVLGLATGAGILFLLTYTLFARWWETREGWYLFVSSAILAVILGYNFAAIQRWFPLSDPNVQNWTRMAVYGGALVIMLWRGLLLIQAQAEAWRVRKAAQLDSDG